MGPIWGRQDPGGCHVGPMNFAIWECIAINNFVQTVNNLALSQQGTYIGGKLKAYFDHLVAIRYTVRVHKFGVNIVSCWLQHNHKSTIEYCENIHKRGQCSDINKPHTVAKTLDFARKLLCVTDPASKKLFFLVHIDAALAFRTATQIGQNPLCLIIKKAVFTILFTTMIGEQNTDFRMDTTQIALIQFALFSAIYRI